MEWVIVMYVGTKVYTGLAENEEACRKAALPTSGITVNVERRPLWDWSANVKPDRIECVPRPLTH